MNGSWALALCSSLMVCLLIGASSVLNAVEYAEPNITRNERVEAKIDTENFEVVLYIGALSLQDFGVNSVTGLRINYHLTEDFFFEIGYGASKASNTSFETLNAVNLLTDDERNISLISANLGWHFMPGETFVTSKVTFTSQLYGLIGLGKVDFAGETDTLIDLGVGYRVLVSDWLALRFDFKDHIFKMDVLGNEQQTHNFETSLGLSVFF